MLRGARALLVASAVLVGCSLSGPPEEGSEDEAGPVPDASSEAAAKAGMRGDARAESVDLSPLVNWDLVALEQNGPRFNASVLTGFHSVRSPGVTPYRAWKAGLGLHYTHEQQISIASNERLFDLDQLTLYPKLVYGFWPRLEAGVGVASTLAIGRRIVSTPSGGVGDEAEVNADLTSLDAGIKWNFLDQSRYRLALSFDTRFANDRGDFGNLPGHIFNFELDGDFAVTRRWSMIGNLQFLTSDSDQVEAQFVGDVAASYSFSDRFRGMLLGTVQEDDEAGTVLGFVGVAGQYVFDQHVITVAVDLRLNEAGREDVRTDDQIDLEISYAFTF